jgi:hypothetical protein
MVQDVSGKAQSLLPRHHLQHSGLVIDVNHLDAKTVAAAVEKATGFQRINILDPTPPTVWLSGLDMVVRGSAETFTS